MRPTFGLLALLFACSSSSTPAERDSAADWWNDAAVYHLYVRSFADSDGDGFGDLGGLTTRLDYIQTLGVNTILVLPLADNDHDIFGGYTPTDVAGLEDDYGNLAELDVFISEAHRRGLRVLLDFPMDPAADSHPFFVSALTAVDSQYHDRFVWAVEPCADIPGLFHAQAWYPVAMLGRCYYSKWDARAPEWNFENPEVQEMFFAAAEQWLARGFDGFRLDAAQHLDDRTTTLPFPVGTEGTHAFLAALMRRIKAANPAAVAVAEVASNRQSDLTPYYRDGIDAVFDFPLREEGILPALLAEDAAALQTAINTKLEATSSGAAGAIFLGNHDDEGRIADLFAGDEALSIQAAALLLSLPGVPFVYYGEEIGLEGAAHPTEDRRWSRNPMQWNAEPGRGFSPAPWAPVADPSANVADSPSLLAAYRTMLETRSREPALRRGRYIPLSVSDPAGFAFLRQTEEREMLFVYKFGATDAQLEIDLSPARQTQATVTDVLLGIETIPLSDTNRRTYPVQMTGRGVRWLALD